MLPDIAKLLDDTADETLDSYNRNRRLRQAVERNFEIMGEAVRHLSERDPDTAERLTGRSRVIAFRNVLIHAYDDLDHTKV